ncbi:hypothetical protein [Amycolatopsis sp. NPDC051061]|uniref:hypothetical protein n=1 Tax=Amycolatopsis sp. NPDC051061 TaxID=3155042 RepID=UPI003427B524
MSVLWRTPPARTVSTFPAAAPQAAGVSLDWELLAQGAQAVEEPARQGAGLAGRCHPQTLRQLKWANAMLKILSPQVLAYPA